ncbi:phosphoenolpyruvate synthase/pyruvate phosphate dikinase [Leptolyngbyaceae cyanobacterium JSC-12]|nr:phosphoenolpyruvate synthase/pyruvate phosphate dikinase [Leptolyngbyaceae cyanobacterium JSC-12]
MTLTQVWGALVIFVVCPLLGGLPLIRWLTIAFTQQKLDQVGTGNVSVSAAFYHGGQLVGLLAVISEALKGIATVLIARSFFPSGSAWEIVALIALVMGRYWFARGAGTTNVVWGYLVHDPVAAGLVLLIGGISFTILRERKQAKFGVLVLFPVITALLHPHNQELMLVSATLAGLMGWIYTKIPDDLDLDPQSAQRGSQSVFRFFQGDRALQTLDHALKPEKVGQKAATLAELKRLGYPVPPGWVLAPGDDPEPLIAQLSPSPKQPFVVRSSALGEDSDRASAAGQYESILSITNRDALLPAITRCFASYHQASAVQYRRDRNLPDTFMTVIVQQQVRGVFSGVAFSRDPILRQGDDVVIEALPGNASQVVSGKLTPETYRVAIKDEVLQRTSASSSWSVPEDLSLLIEGAGSVPPQVIQQVAYLARHLEAHYHGIPQDIEWSYDGRKLWLLQSRPVTTLLPIWTRKIASEVIPGLIHPLTWSINRPLTCGVWGEIFSIVLGKRAHGLDFTETATLHYSRAYFNASLLGEIFRRMGLPPESLEFLTRGTKFSKPPLLSTLRNVPGLLRLLGRELQLEKDFRRDFSQVFVPAIAIFSDSPVETLTSSDLLIRINHILVCLKQATYYSILAPLSAALRKTIAKVKDEDLDNSSTPEVAALRSLQDLARSARQLLDTTQIPADSTALFTELTKHDAGREVLAQLDQTINRYGYLSEVGTDIAVPTWKEKPEPIRDLFAQFCLHPPDYTPLTVSPKATKLQRRFDLKGHVTEVYSRLLAELRWSFVALEQQWLETGWLLAPGDIFFLTFEEVRQLVQQGHIDGYSVADVIAQRKTQLGRDRQLEAVPFIVYGEDPPTPLIQHSAGTAGQQLQGIGASAGQVEGQVKIILSLNNLPEISKDTIVVVPYTDSGWAPLLARAGGLIAETGGRLSHGAIVAREYRIPAVMDVHNATQILQNDQLVRIDGEQGIVEILQRSPLSH